MSKRIAFGSADGPKKIFGADNVNWQGAQRAGGSQVSGSVSDSRSDFNTNYSPVELRLMQDKDNDQYVEDTLIYATTGGTSVADMQQTVDNSGLEGYVVEEMRSEGEDSYRYVLASDDYTYCVYSKANQENNNEIFKVQPVRKADVVTPGCEIDDEQLLHTNAFTSDELNDIVRDVIGGNTYDIGNDLEEVATAYGLSVFHENKNGDPEEVTFTSDMDYAGTRRGENGELMEHTITYVIDKNTGEGVALSYHQDVEDESNNSIGDSFINENSDVMVEGAEVHMIKNYKENNSLIRKMIPIER